MAQEPTEFAVSANGDRWFLADSDVKPAAIPIKDRPPFRFEAGHRSDQRPASFRH